MGYSYVIERAGAARSIPKKRKVAACATSGKEVLLFQKTI